LVSRYVVSWVLPVLWRGYRHPLVMDNLGSIDRKLYSISTWNEFSPYCEKEVVRYKSGKTRQPLCLACLRALKYMLAAPLFPSLVSSVLTMARPLIILHTVKFVQDYTSVDANPPPLADGCGLVGATFLTYGTYAFSMAIAHVTTQLSALALRGALMEARYRKSLVSHVETAREMGSAKVGNLMSVDVMNIVDTIPELHQTWTAVTTTGVGFYIIWTQIGLCFVSQSP